MEKPIMPAILRVSPGFLVVGNPKVKQPPRAVYYTRDKAQDLVDRLSGFYVKECWLLVLDDGRVLVLSESQPLVPEIDLVEDEKRRKQEAWRAAAEKLTPEERALLGVCPPILEVGEEPEEFDPAEDEFDTPVGRKPATRHRERIPARGNS